MKYPKGKHPNSRKNSPFIKGHKIIGGIETRFKKGHKLSKEHIKTLKEIRLGKHLSEDTRRKIGEANAIALKGRVGFWKGKHHSDKTKRLLSKLGKGKKHTLKTKEKMRFSAIHYISAVCGSIRPNLGRNEKKILDRLEQETGYKILRQYSVEGYFIDGYIKELNLVIEVDERPKNKEKDIEREKIIRNKLNCRFMRINDFD